MPSEASASGHPATPIAIALVELSGRYLVGQRSDDQVLPGCVEFPGGKCRSGERPDEAAVRECLEETGIAVQVVGLRSVVRHEYAHGIVELHFFDCRPISQDEGALHPCPPFRWAPATELAELPFPLANERVIRELSGREHF